MKKRVYREGIQVMWLSRFRRELAGACCGQRNKDFGGGGDEAAEDGRGLVG